MNVLVHLYLLSILGVKWVLCKPTIAPFTNFIDTQSLKNLVEKENSIVKLLDFRSNNEREVFGYIQGSILVPDFLTSENVDDPPHSIAREIFFNEKDEKGKQVVFITNKRKLGEVYQTLIALGYLEAQDSIKGYIEGINALREAGGEIELPRIINFYALQESLNLGSTLLIDVRNRSELNSPGQIPSSVCLPLHEILNGAFQLASAQFRERYGFAKPIQSDIFILTCRSGRRILVAEKYMKSLGYNHIRIYPGSFKDWVVKGGRTINADFSLDYETL